MYVVMIVFVYYDVILDLIDFFIVLNGLLVVFVKLWVGGNLIYM